MEPILRVQNLTKTFTRSGQSNLTAVNGISFDLLPGECLGIIGESGSGKTTAVNLITRLLDATEGRIFLDGEDITLKTGKSLRMIYRKMQMVFQTPTDSFDPRRTLGDGIGESLRNCGMTRTRRQSGFWNGADCLLPLPGGIRTRSAADSASAQRLPAPLL